MKKRRPRPLKIRVMAEYGSSGLWGFGETDNGPFRHGMLEYRALDLPDELCAGFRRWIQRYEDENLSHRLDPAAFNAEGLRLAGLLKRYLGTNQHVEYQGESPEGGLLPSVVVE